MAASLYHVVAEPCGSKYSRPRDGNQSPVLTSIGAQSTDEDVNLNFIVSATDIEDTPSLSASPLPGTATFVDNDDGTGTFDWTPTYLESGDYDVTFTATDDSGNSSTGQTVVTVEDTTPPDISLSDPIPSVLWPPNHKFVDVVIFGTAGDICDADLDIEVSVDVLDAEGGDGGPNHDPD